MSRFVSPETTVLTLASGETLTVKRYLNEGERRAAYAHMYQANGEGPLRLSPQQYAINLVLAYLLDWSLTDDSGRQVVIRDKSPEEMRATVDSLFPEDFNEIYLAIDAHEAREVKARQEKKRMLAGAPAPEATSISAK